MPGSYHYRDSMEGIVKNSELKCPRDNSHLNIVSEGKMGANKCLSCSGVLVDIKQIPSVRKLKHQKMMSLRISELHCPICCNEMREFTYKSVDIDICSGCKCVWLDPGEDVIIDKGQSKNEETKWYDHLDPFSAIVGGTSSSSKSACSGADSGVLDFIGDAIGSIFDGF